MRLVRRVRPLKALMVGLWGAALAAGVSGCGGKSEVSVAVPSERARTLRPETPLEVLDSQGKVLISSPLFFVAPQADPRTQLVEVKAAFRNTVDLRPSELVRARLIYSTRETLQLPALAVVRQ
ncbi:MFP transporter [Melittangium boletus DSM 14713]|uniref:MFP transporter n=1 Tax=Melittangium boletus DSM 14713 TaxID=1294270 RepID=A0A250IQX3_9BACT|nr:MFP transporter [Melittangium boletus DSM 14713]